MLAHKVMTISALTSDNRCFYATGIIPDEKPSMNTLLINYLDESFGRIQLRYNNNFAFHIFPLTGKNAEFLAVKLELGSVQTLAHQDTSGSWVLNDPPPDRALELAKCQRYQLPLQDKSGNYGCPIGYGIYQNGLCRIAIPAPTTMRGAPTLTVLNGSIEDLQIIDSLGNSHSIATITTNGKFNNQVYLGITINEPITAGPLCALKYGGVGIPMLDANL